MSTSPPNTRATSGRRTRRNIGRARRARSAVVILVLTLLPALLVGLHVRAYEKVSPIDELQHIDYLYKAPHLVRPGDLIGQDAMRAEACRGLDFPSFPLPRCGADIVYEPGEFQEKGYNTASINTPVYYTLTQGMGRVIVALTPADDLVTGGRLAGAVWLSVALLLTYRAGRMLGARRDAMLGVLVVLACLPSTLYPSAIISPDAAVLACGALVVLTVVWFDKQPRRRWWALALVSFVVLAVKMTNLYVLFAVGMAYLVRLVTTIVRDRWPTGGAGGVADPSVDPQPGRPRAAVVAIGAVSTAAALFVVTWLGLQRVMAHGNPADIPMTAQFTVTEFNVRTLVAHLGEFLNPMSTVWVYVGDPAANNVVQRLGGLLIAGGLIAALLRGRHLGDQLRSLAVGWGVVGLVGPALVVLMAYLSYRSYFPVPARYGYSLVPGMAVLTALQIRSRGIALTVGLMGLSGLVLTILRLT